MGTPHLTYFVEVGEEPLRELFATAGLIDFLCRSRASISMGLLDLSPSRAEIVRRLEDAGIGVTGWLLLDVAEGYWLNADNTAAARRRFHETVEWCEREKLRLARIGLDIECPRADADLLVENPRSGLFKLIGRRRSAEQVERAEREYADLVREIRATGRGTETYHFPQLIDERLAGTRLLRRALGLVDVAADAEVFMLYASYLGVAGARAYFSEAPCIALGVTGGGVHADSPREQRRFLKWEDFEQDLLAAAVATREVYIFSLEGCVQRDMIRRLEGFDWNRPPAPIALGGARRQRQVLSWILKSEPLLDMIQRRS